MIVIRTKSKRHGLLIKHSPAAVIVPDNLAPWGPCILKFVVLWSRQHSSSCKFENEFLFSNHFGSKRLVKPKFSVYISIFCSWSNGFVTSIDPSLDLASGHGLIAHDTIQIGDASFPWAHSSFGKTPKQDNVQLLIISQSVIDKQQLEEAKR